MCLHYKLGIEEHCFHQTLYRVSCGHEQERLHRVPHSTVLDVAMFARHKYAIALHNVTTKKCETILSSFILLCKLAYFDYKK